MRTVEIVLSLVLLATVVATFAQRLRVPAPSLLVIAGLAVGVIPGVPIIRATPDLVSLVVLPPLLYAAGEQLPWHQVRQVWRPVTVLAVGLVAASAAAVAAVTVAITSIPLATAFVLGAVLASTDPVAVTALSRRLGLPARIQALVSAESLFNDATSLVLFRVALSVVVAGGSVAWGSAALQFFRLAGGGSLIGAAVGTVVVVARRRIDDPLVDTVAALVTPYLVYVVAEAAHTSGVTAVVIASLTVGTRMGRRSAARSRLQVDAVYNTVIFLLESVVFALIGLQLPVLIGDLPASQGSWPWAAGIIALTLVAVRVAWVFPLAAMNARRPGAPHRSWQVPAVVSWAGARGVVPLAAALSIPLTATNGSPLGDRPLVVVVATVVIAVTLVVQGLSLEPLVRSVGLQANDKDRRSTAMTAQRSLARRARDHLDELARLEAASAHVLDRLRDGLDRRAAPAEEEEQTDNEVAYRSLRRQLIAVESDELDRLHRRGDIDEPTRQRLQRALDLEDARLDDQSRP
ncbi:MAG: Na+/H+ antiporter [Actinomycetota bacterium]|nr:Na+/H+ antiporter [Actinomycetota bacterium]